MNKLSKTLHPVYFWSSMAVASFLALLVINLNYKIIVNYSATAAEVSFVTGNENIVKENSGDDDFIGCECETRFKKAYPVVWSGRVTATFVSGEDIGVKRFDKRAKYKQFYVDAQSKYKGDLGGNVRVTGRLVGLTCAYANTVFGGCIAEVEADRITSL